MRLRFELAAALAQIDLVVPELERGATFAERLHRHTEHATPWRGQTTVSMSVVWPR
jgi:hypothetical protein